jgi:hypothetical protein
MSSAISDLKKLVESVIGANKNSAVFETRFLDICDDVDQFTNRKRETAFGIGVIVFDGAARLSPVAEALLSIFETAAVSKYNGVDPGYEALAIRARARRVDEKEIIAALVSLGRGTASNSRYAHVEEVAKALKESGVPISNALYESLGMLDEVDDILTALLADTGSNVSMVEFTMAVACPGRAGRYANGYTMRMSNAVSTHHDLRTMKRFGAELDIALHAADVDELERVLSEMVQDVFVSIRHPALRAKLAERLLAGRARELMQQGTRDAVEAYTAGEIH